MWFLAALLCTGLTVAGLFSPLFWVWLVPYWILFTLDIISAAYNGLRETR